MAKRSILIHPDPRLRKTAEPVEAVDDATRQLIADMFETMYEAPGIGLAAPQVGVQKRVFVMDCAGRDEETDAPQPPEPRAFVNPEVIWAAEEQRSYREGCLSVPDEFDDVTRPTSVTVAYLDEDGERREETFDGVRATCVQHEIDHLNGKLFIDYIGQVKRAMITNRMKKLKRERAKERAKERS